MNSDIFWPLRVHVPVGGVTPLGVWFRWHFQFFTAPTAPSGPSAESDGIRGVVAARQPYAQH